MPFLLLIYALNTVYLAAFASPTLFYYSNVVFHIVAGLGLTALWSIRLVRWRPRSSGWSSRGMTIFVSIAALVLLAGIGFGLFITVVGAAGGWRALVPRRPRHSPTE